MLPYMGFTLFTRGGAERCTYIGQLELLAYTAAGDMLPLSMVSW